MHFMSLTVRYGLDNIICSVHTLLVNNFWRTFSVPTAECFACGGVFSYTVIVFKHISYSSKIPNICHAAVGIPVQTMPIVYMNDRRWI